MELDHVWNVFILIITLFLLRHKLLKTFLFHTISSFWFYGRPQPIAIYICFINGQYLCVPFILTTFSYKSADICSHPGSLNWLMIRLQQWPNKKHRINTLNRISAYSAWRWIAFLIDGRSRRIDRRYAIAPVEFCLQNSFLFVLSAYKISSKTLTF